MGIIIFKKNLYKNLPPLCVSNKLKFYKVAKAIKLR